VFWKAAIVGGLRWGETVQGGSLFGGRFQACTWEGEHSGVSAARRETGACRCAPVSVPVFSDVFIRLIPSGYDGRSKVTSCA
jgi:hypothetical protein